MALTQILGLTLIPVGATLLGGAIATFRVPSARARSLLQHFAAGVVMAVVAGELLPEMTREHRPLGVLIGFALGVGLMLGVKAMAQRIEGRGEQGGSGNFGLLVTVGIDVLLDGVLIGVGFAAGERVGTLLIVALTLELLFLGVSVAASLGERRRVPAKATWVPRTFSSARRPWSSTGSLRSPTLTAIRWTWIWSALNSRRTRSSIRWLSTRSMMN